MVGVEQILEEKKQSCVFVCVFVSRDAPVPSQYGVSRGGLSKCSSALSLRVEMLAAVGGGTRSDKIIVTIIEAGRDEDVKKHKTERGRESEVQERDRGHVCLLHACCTAAFFSTRPLNGAAAAKEEKNFLPLHTAVKKTFYTGGRERRVGMPLIQLPCHTTASAPFCHFFFASPLLERKRPTPPVQRHRLRVPPPSVRNRQPPFLYHSIFSSFFF